MELKGDRIEKTIIIATVVSAESMAPRYRMRVLKRCINGSASGRMYDPVAATIVAMIFSAGASAPIRPV